MTTAAAAPRAAVETDTLVELGEPFDLPRTLGVLQRGNADPAIRVDPGHFGSGLSGASAAGTAASGTPGAGAWMAMRCYDDAGAHLGAATLRFDQLDSSRVRVRIAATEPQAATAAATRAPGILGAQDRWGDLQLLLDARADPLAHRLARIRREHPGVRLPATGALFDQLVTATLEQKVTHEQARHGWRNLLRRHGDPAPSSMVVTPEWLRLPLSPQQLRRVPSWQWHKLWVQPPMSRTICRVAERAAAIHRLSAGTALDACALEQLAQRLQSIPGIGAWTVAEALQRSHGAADLPAVGDYHLAHFVGEALTGRRTDDAGMLQLLEPFRPHRQRIVRLLGLSGFRMQRFGARLAPEDHRHR